MASTSTKAKAYKTTKGSKTFVVGVKEFMKVDTEPGHEEEVPLPMLQRAHDTIHGQRQADYGDKLQNFSQIAMLFQGTLAMKLLPHAEITAEDVALLMMQVKIARLAKSPDHADSILDVAGYAGCFDNLQMERKKGVTLKGATYDSRQHDYSDKLP